MFLGKFRGTDDTIHISIGEVGSRADELKGSRSIPQISITRGLILPTHHDRVRVSSRNKRVRNARAVDRKWGSHGFLHPGKIYLAGDRVDWNSMEFDLQVCASLVECGVGGSGDDSEWDMSRTVMCLWSHRHFRFCSSLGRTSPITVGLHGHNDALGTTRSHRSCTGGIVEHSAARLEVRKDADLKHMETTSASSS